jgi:hypothetical protein
MKKIKLYVLILFLFFGCASTQKVIVLQSENNVKIHHMNDGSLLLNLPTHIFEWDKKGKIVSDLSYAIDGKGEKYNLITEPFLIAHSHPKPTTDTSDILWLNSPQKSSGKLKWYNNFWKIHVVLRTQDKLDIFEINFEVKDK